MTSYRSRFRRIAVAAACITALFAFDLAAPSLATAEKCNPADPETCVGGPTGKVCGGQNQPCCNVNGYPFDCRNDDLSCNASNQCVITWRAYHVTCTSGRTYNISSLPSRVDNDAAWYCGGWGTVADVHQGWN